MKESLKALRKDKRNSLDETTVEKDPVRQFEKWFREMLSSNFEEPTAVVVATSTRQGKPSVRTVLMKSFDEKGFSFFTNYTSKKGKELQANPQAAMLFYWDKLERQIRIEGKAKKMSAAESDKYFDSRARQSRMSAIASLQSRVIKNRAELIAKVKELEGKYAGQEKIPRPKEWGGFMLIPDYFEFWQGRESRLHDRIIYERTRGKWKISRLAP